jgi:hypothetical protein
MTQRDIIEALSPIFHLPDGRRLQLRIAAADQLCESKPRM